MTSHFGKGSAVSHASDPSSISSFLLAELEQAVLHVLDQRRLDLRAAATARTSIENLWLQRDLEQELCKRPQFTVTAQMPIVVDAKTKLVDLVQLASTR